MAKVVSQNLHLAEGRRIQLVYRYGFFHCPTLMFKVWGDQGNLIYGSEPQRTDIDWMHFTKYDYSGEVGLPPGDYVLQAIVDCPGPEVLVGDLTYRTTGNYDGTDPDVPDQPKKPAGLLEGVVRLLQWATGMVIVVGGTYVVVKYVAPTIFKRRGGQK